MVDIVVHYSEYIVEYLAKFDEYQENYCQRAKPIANRAWQPLQKFEIESEAEKET